MKLIINIIAFLLCVTIVNADNYKCNKAWKNMSTLHDQGKCLVAIDIFKSAEYQKNCTNGVWLKLGLSSVSKIYKDTFKNCKDMNPNQEKAFKYFKEYVLLNKSATDYSELAMIYAFGDLKQKKDIEKAIKYYKMSFEKAITRFRRFRYSGFAIGNYYYNKNQFEKAYKYLNESRKNSKSIKLLKKLCNQQPSICKRTKIKTLDPEIAIHYFTQGKILKCNISNNLYPKIITNSSYRIMRYTDFTTFNKTTIQGDEILNAEESINDCILYKN